MKYRTTNKAIKEGYVKVICVGYCNLQHLLSYKSPIAYTCGRDGWNADVYDFGQYAICTGYRPTGHIRPAYDVVERYDSMAQGLLNSNLATRERLDNLIDEFLEEVVTCKTA